MIISNREMIKKLRNRSYIQTHYTTQTHQSNISIQNTVNAKIKKFTLFGNSIQVGIPSAANPAEIKCLSDFDIVCTDGASKTTTVHCPVTVSAMGDVRDSLTVNKEVKLTQRTMTVTIDNTAKIERQVAGVVKRDDTCEAFIITLPGRNGLFLTSHFRQLTWADWSGNTQEGTYGYWVGSINIKVRNTTLGIIGKPTLDTFKAWLADNPVTVQYVLSEPVETVLTGDWCNQLLQLHSYLPYTHISVDSKNGVNCNFIECILRVIGL